MGDSDPLLAIGLVAAIVIATIAGGVVLLGNAVGSSSS